MATFRIAENRPVSLDSADNLYGTAAYGGISNSGVVFKLDATGQQTVLYGSPGSTDGAAPFAAVIRDSAGNLFGTAAGGDVHGAGIVFKLDSAGHESILYSFKVQL